MLRRIVKLRYLSKQIRQVNRYSSIISSPHSDVHIPDQTLTEYLFDKQEEFAGRTAIVCGETGASQTHGEIRSNAIKLASALTRLDISANEVVAIVLPNCIEYPICVLGISHAGAVASTVSFGFTKDEMKRQLNNSGATAVICNSESAPTVLEIANDKPTLRHIISIDSEGERLISFSKLLKDDGKGINPSLNVNPKEDAAALLYSSGTTGLPKGVMLTHRNILANLQQAFHPDVTYLSKAKGDFQEKYILVLPMYHMYALSIGLFWSILSGAKSISMKSFDTALYVNLHKKYQPTVVPTVPSMLSFLCASPHFTPQMVKDSKTHTLICGGAPIGDKLMKKFRNKFGDDVLPMEGYGMTECGPAVCMSPKKGFILGSCGVLVPNTQAKIIDSETGKTLKFNEGRGELLIKGPQAMKGYLKNETATKDMISPDGWVKTGDTATVDENGYFHIVDRIKDLIKVKGLQVSPAEVEQVLAEFPGVADVAVIGVPNERSGQLPKAFIVPEPETEISKEEIFKYVQTKLSEHKHLSGGIEFIKTIPRTRSGKVQKQFLK